MDGMNGVSRSFLSGVGAVVVVDILVVSGVRSGGVVSGSFNVGGRNWGVHVFVGGLDWAGRVDHVLSDGGGGLSGGVGGAGDVLLASIDVLLAASHVLGLCARNVSGLSSSNVSSLSCSGGISALLHSRSRDSVSSLSSGSVDTADLGSRNSSFHFERLIGIVNNLSE